MCVCIVSRWSKFLCSCKFLVQMVYLFWYFSKEFPLKIKIQLFICHFLYPQVFVSVFNKMVFARILCLIYLMSFVSFCNLWKHPKTKGFMMLLEGAERDQWHELGWYIDILLVFIFFGYFIRESFAITVPW